MSAKPNFVISASTRLSFQQQPKCHFSSNPIVISGDNMSSAVGHLWDALFALMIVVAVLGNTAVLWIVIRKSVEDDWMLQPGEM